MRNLLRSLKTKLKPRKYRTPKILVILGPTASGKSELAVKLARKFNGEIISADSRQVYKGLDIGSGKVPRDKNETRHSDILKNVRMSKDYFYKGIQHRLLDVASPRKVFTVTQYQKLAKRAIEDILKRGKLPIICGGTGLYIDSVIYDLKFPKVLPQKKLRAKLEKLTTNELFARISRVDPKRAKAIDRNNRRRLIRALEIVEYTGKPIPELTRSSPYNVLKIGIKITPEKLKEDIKRRLEERLKLGMVNEAKNLHAGGLSWRRFDDFGLEYRYVSRYLHGLINYKKMKENVLRDSYRYAKRQMTWWRKDKEIIWIENRADLLNQPKLKALYVRTGKGY